MEVKVMRMYEQWRDEGVEFSIPVPVLRKDEEARLREDGIYGPALEVTLARGASERHKSRVAAAIGAALQTAVAAWGHPDTVAERRVRLAQAAMLCAIEAHIATGTRAGFPVYGNATRRQAWVWQWNLGSGRKHAGDGDSWDAAFDAAASRLIDLACDWRLTGQELLGALIPGVVVNGSPGIWAIPGDMAAFPVAEILDETVCGLEADWAAAVSDFAYQQVQKVRHPRVRELKAAWAHVYNACVYVANEITPESTEVTEQPWLGLLGCNAPEEWALYAGQRPVRLQDYLPEEGADSEPLAGTW